MTENSVRVYNTADETGENAGQNVMDNMRSMLGRVDVKGLVNEYPVEASLLALGLGVVAALLFMPGAPDKYDKLERRLQKSMKDVVKVKQEADEEIAELREAARQAEKERHKAEKRAKEAEDRLEEAEREAAEESQGEKPSSWRALMFSALGAQLVHLLTRWVSDRIRPEREEFEAASVGHDQPVSSEYTYTPPI